MELIDLKYMGAAVYQVTCFLNRSALVQFKEFTGLINLDKVIPLVTAHALAV